MLKKNVGGIQQPFSFVLPNSTWIAPKELPALTSVAEIALDCETQDIGLKENKGPGWATKAGHICGIAIAWKEEDYRSIYIPITHPESSNFDRGQVRRWLRHLLQKKVRFIYHNAAYDIGWISSDLGLPPPQQIDDSSCMAYMIDEGGLNYRLDTLCKTYDVPGKQEEVLRDYAQAMGFDPKKDIYQMPARYVGTYGEADALGTLALAHALRPIIIKEELSAAYDLEMELVPMVHAMRQRGICIDYDKCEQLYYRFKEQSQVALVDLTDRIGKTTGIDDIRSVKWLERVFQAEQISYPYTNKPNRDGSPRGSFEAKWMKKHPHWLPRLITRAKSREEAAEKFVKGYLMDFCTEDSRIHPTINQYRGESPGDDEDSSGGTRTYRFSYADPPLQQIPHRDPEMAEIRSVFIGEDGERWLSVDYSQQEFRLMVHYAYLQKLSGAAAARQRYQEDPNTDFHAMVAEMTGLERKPAKDCNFAKAYGAGVDKFAMMIGQSKEAAARIMNQYDERLPFVKMLYTKCKERVEDRGYIVLLDGARIRFDWWNVLRAKYEKDNNPDYQADCRWNEAQRRVHDPENKWYQQKLHRSRTNKAMNALIQGGAARQTKIAMRDVWRAGYCPVLQIHDELCFSIANEKQAQEIAEIMRIAVPLALPMKVDAEIGDSWMEKKE